MKFSTWSPFGLLKYKKGEPVAKQLYETAKRLFGDPDKSLAQDPGTFVDVASFAAARMAALVAGKVERAGAQQFAAGVYDLLQDQEAEHKLIPGPGASVHQRKVAFAAQRKLPAGCARPEFEEALITLLGNNYVGLHITTPSEQVMWPATLGAQPQNLQPAEVERKLIRILEPIAIGLGGSMVVPYLAVDPTGERTESTLTIDDVVVLEPEILGRAEHVTVTATGVLSGNPTFTAVVNNAHEAWSWGTTMPFPIWTGSQREVVVVVKPSAAITSEVRRQVHELLERMVTGVTTWALVQEGTTPGTAGPFTLDADVLGLLDLTPLGAVTPP